MEGDSKERLKILIIYPLKAHLCRSGLLIIYIILLYFNPSIADLLTIDIDKINIITFTYGIFFYLILLYISYPILSDFDFYLNYFNNKDTISKIKFLTENGKNIDYNSFLKNYDLFRKKIRARVIHSNSNFLTYDYELNRIIQNIDIFFDVSVKLLLKNKIKSTNYNFSDIDKFIESFGDTLIQKPMPLDINLIKQYFKKWNSKLQHINYYIFEETKNDVEKYYNKKKLKKTIIPYINGDSLVFKIIAGIMLPIISIVISYLK